MTAPRTSINRSLLTRHQFLESDSYISSQRHSSKGDWLKKCNCKKFWLETFPIVQWMSEYNIKRDLPRDIIAGVTVTVLHIPQGIANGFLANVPSVCGLYTAFFTAFVYVIFGTSRHNNVGTFAVICLMVGQSVVSYSSLDENGIELAQHDDITKIGGVYKNIEVLSMVTFTVAMYMLIMYILRLGIITSILSQTLVNAFTTACAIHLIASQLKDLFGLCIQRRSHDYFTIGFTLYDISKNIQRTNYVAVIMSAITLTVSIIHIEVVKPRLSKKCPVPIPMEMIVVVFGTIASYFLDLHSEFQLPVIGKIPTGLPWPVLPRFELFPKVAFECLPITLVTYILTMSIGFIFARKGSYLMYPNQELLALGFVDLLGSFFLCLPVAASMSRTAVVYNVGGMSQLSNLISALLLLLVLLYISPLIEYTPKCVLACIIISSIYPMLFQAKALRKFWLLSRLDALIWAATFIGTLVIDIKYGLFLGIAASVLVICYHFCRPNSYLLGLVPGTEIYMSNFRYKEVEEQENLKIFRYEGGINFASKDIFKKHLVKTTGINAKQMIIDRKRASRKLKPGQTLPPIELPIRCIILDFSAVTHVDPAGVETIRNVEKDHREVGITILFCSASDEICGKLANYDKVEKMGHHFTIFISVHDAVLYANESIL